MTAGRLIFPGQMPCVTSDGERIPGAKAYFYLNGSTTLLDTFTDATLTVRNTNPVVADSVGVWPQMWADTANIYLASLTDAVGLPLPGGTWSGLGSAIDAALASATLAESAQAVAELAATDAQTAQAGAETAEAQAQAYAASIAGAPLSATSVSSLTVGTGLKTLILDQLGKLFSIGQTVVIAETSAPANQMVGVIQDVDPLTGDMTVNVGSVTGAGTHIDWTISLGATAGVPGTRQISAAGLATGGGDFSADRTITVPAAAAADIRTGTDATKAVTAAALTGAAAFGALTDAATVAWDAAAIGFNAKVTIAGNRVFGAPTNLSDGLTYTLDISQDATGTRVPSWNAIWDWGSVGAPTLSTGANKKDKVIAQYSAASGKLEASFRKAA